VTLRGCGTLANATEQISAIDIEKRGRRVSFLTPYLTVIQIIQIILGVALTIAILLQARGAGLGSVFGGTGTVFKTRRGIDRLLFRITIVFAILFCLVSTLGATVPAA
jgi:preprotein translocase subunit SecG